MNLPEMMASTRGTIMSQGQFVAMANDRSAARRRLVSLKEQFPENFCQADGCLHVVAIIPCPFHPIGARVRIVKKGVEDSGKFGRVDRASGPFLWVVLEDDGEEMKVPNDWVEVVEE